MADWHREEIKAAIRKTGTSLTALALRHDYEASAVRKALSRPWPAVERIIADHLATEPKAIWPSRYDPDGNPRRTARSTQHTRPARRRHRQNERRALT